MRSLVLSVRRGRVLAQGDAAQNFARAAVRKVSDEVPMVPDDEPPVGHLPSVIVGAVVDEAQALPGRLSPNAESGEVDVS